MARLRLILGLGLLGALLWLGWKLAVANSSPVTVDYLVGEYPDAVQWHVILLAFAAGACAMGLLLVFEKSKSWLMRRRYRKRVAELESEVHQLRSLPLSNEPSAAVDELAAGASASSRGA